MTRCAQIDFEIRKVPNYYTPLDDNLFIAASFNSWASGSLAHKLTRHTFDTYSINLEIPLGNLLRFGSLLYWLKILKILL